MSISAPEQANDTQVVTTMLSEPQAEIINSRAAIILDMAGQGSGKSENIGNCTGLLIAEFPKAQGFIGANTNLQLSQSTLRSVFKTWKKNFGFTKYDKAVNPGGNYVVDKQPPAHFTKFEELRDYHGTISFANGCLSYIGSLENYSAHEGKEFTWAHLDETKDTKEEALKEVISGRLRQIGLWYDTSGDLFWNEHLTEAQAIIEGFTAWNPLYIHTSPALRTVTWLNEMFQLHKFDKEIKKAVTQEERAFFNKRFDNKHIVIYPVHHNRYNLPPNYIKNRETTLHDEDSILKLVCGYPFGKTGGEWITTFRRDKHVSKVDFLQGLAIYQTWDFNVSPYMTCLAAQILEVVRYIDDAGMKYTTPAAGRRPIQVEQVRIYKKYCFRAPRNTTKAICEQFTADHNIFTDTVFYYGDASGNSQIPGLGSTTNYKLIADYLAPFINNNSKRVKGTNMEVFTRRDLVNSILAGEFPHIEVIIDESCTELIEDLEECKQGPNGKVKQMVEDPATGAKYQKYGHCTDALEYLLCELYKHLIKK